MFLYRYGHMNINKMRYFSYGDEEIDYLKSSDARLAAVIDRTGHIYRAIEPDLFTALVHQIVGQQISNKALTTIWNRFLDKFADSVRADKVLAIGSSGLKELGISSRKAEYILELSQKVNSGDLDLSAISILPDDEVVSKLTELRGVGAWTAEMTLLFCLERPNVFSYNDLAIRQGLKLLYDHKEITPTLLDKYRRKFSPYCSVASLYLWSIAASGVRSVGLATD